MVICYYRLILLSLSPLPGYVDLINAYVEHCHICMCTSRVESSRLSGSCKAGLGDAMETVIKKKFSAYSISFITRIALLLCVEIKMMHGLSEGMAGNFVPVHRTINLLSPKILPNVAVVGVTGRCFMPCLLVLEQNMNTLHLNHLFGRLIFSRLPSGQT